MTCFLHTGDWQLGMTRHFLSEEAQARFTQARFDAIRVIGRLAQEHAAAFVIAAGDVFDDHAVGPGIVARALEALRDVPVPVYLLPGNHDALHDASVYRSSAFVTGRPAHVHVIEDGTPVRVADGVELVGAPWRSRRPGTNPLLELLDGLPPAGETIRVVAGHGGLDTFTPEKDEPGLLPRQALLAAARAGKFHYLALGDRHSFTRVDGDGRIAYAGSPEATDWREDASGFVARVTLEQGKMETIPLRAGRWRFVRHAWRFAGDGEAETEAVRAAWEAEPDKDCAVLRAEWSGTLGLEGRAALEQHLAWAEAVFAGVRVKEENLRVTAAGDAAAGFSGFTASAAERLRVEMASPDPETAATARDALLLLAQWTAEGGA